jgi:hypothetical protein
LCQPKKGKHDILSVLNPFTKTAMKLPCSYDGGSITFSSVPTSPDFMVFVSSDFCINIWWPGDRNWTRYSTFLLSSDFSVYLSDLYLSQGEFYCLGKMGDLAVYKPANETWLIVNRPARTNSDGQHELLKYYLMEIEGELISVSHKTRGLQEPIQVFRLDKSEMVWNKIEDLGNLTLFLCLGSSIARPSPFNGCENKIFFPRYDSYSKLGARYSLETNLYQLMNLFTTKVF